MKIELAKESPDTWRRVRESLLNTDASDVIEVSQDE